MASLPAAPYPRICQNCLGASECKGPWTTLSWWVEVPRRQHTGWQVASWTSVSEHEHPQLLASCLAAGAKFCSLRRGTCASCILLQFQRPQVLLLLQLPQHYLLQTGKISLPDVLSPGQRRRAARCWHCGSQGTGSSGGKGTVEGGTVSHWVPGVLQSWMENVWADECMACLWLQRLQRRCCRWCAL